MRQARDLTRAFRFALRGIIKTFLSERNMRIHTAAAFYVVIAGMVCGIERWEWCAVLACIAAVTSLFFGGGYTAAAAAFAQKHPLWAAAIVLTVPLWVKIIFFMRRSNHADN